MKKVIGSSVLIVTSLCFFIFCGDKGTNGSNGSNPYTRVNIVGDWVSEINLSLIYFGIYDINLSIMTANSSFEMSVVKKGQKNNDIIYKHTGTWRIGKEGFSGNDSLYLIGKECYIIDTVAGEYTLRKLDKSIAEQTVVLDTTRNENDEWIIELRSLTPFVSAIVPSLVKDYVIPVISGYALTFERKKKIFIR